MKVYFVRFKAFISLFGDTQAPQTTTALHPAPFRDKTDRMIQAPTLGLHQTGCSEDSGISALAGWQQESLKNEINKFWSVLLFHCGVRINRELPFLSICSCSHQNQSSKQPLYPLSPLYPFLHLFSFLSFAHRGSASPKILNN